jgi:DNA-binding PadR family transcriptional regulator
MAETALFPIPERTERLGMSSVRMTQITALVLRAIASGRQYGFDVMEACGLPSGTVYPALRRLERAGLLRSGWEDAEEARSAGRPRRRTYRLTSRGREALPEAEAKLDEVRRLLGQFGPAPREA